MVYALAAFTAHGVRIFMSKSHYRCHVTDGSLQELACDFLAEILAARIGHEKVMTPNVAVSGVPPKRKQGGCPQDVSLLPKNSTLQPLA